MRNSDWSEICTCISPAIMNIVFDDFRFTAPTPVQVACIPQLVVSASAAFRSSHKDLVVQAVTGSGKTLAFLLPIVQMVCNKLSLHTQAVTENSGATSTATPDLSSNSSPSTYALIISPTRELALQTSRVLARFSRRLHFAQHQFVGGYPIERHIEAVRERPLHVLVCTPGRLCDLLSERDSTARLVQSLRALELLVLDEADRLLYLGLRDQLLACLAKCPKQRRTALFSATQTEDLRQLVLAGLRNPLVVHVQQCASGTSTGSAPCGQLDGTLSRTPLLLQNYYAACEYEERVHALLRLLGDRVCCRKQKVIVFVSTCAMVDYLSALLAECLPECDSVFALHRRVHGGCKQSRRMRVYQQFSDCASAAVLLCTDVMARGIDIAEVDLVIQYDAPSSGDMFVHRCGRTARVCRPGDALILLSGAEMEYVEFLRRNQRVQLTRFTLPCESPVDGAVVRSRMFTLQLSDRAVMDMAVRALVSFVKFYSKHECNYIFQLSNLDLGRLANGLFLVRVPKMPEQKFLRTSDFVGANGVDFNQLAYKSPKLEARRQMKLKHRVERRKQGGCVKGRIRSTGAWSKTKQKRSEHALKLRAKRGARASRRCDAIEDWNEVMRDARDMKKEQRKLKTGSCIL